MQLVLKSKSKEDTIQIARLLSQVLTKEDVVLLKGALGAGKTTFAQGIAKGLGIKEQVKSPTFNIVKIYHSGSLPLFHIDAYRLEGQKQEIGLDEYMTGDGVCLIEWPQFLDLTCIKNPVIIQLERLSVQERDISIQMDDKRGFSIEKEVAKWRIHS